MTMYKLIWLLCATLPWCAAQDLKEFEKKVTEFTLGNGLHFIVLERHEAPVVSLVTRVNVGGANDSTGRTGMAHMFEHMAFKGTDTLGTTNWAEEKKVLAEVETIYDKLDSEKNKGPRGSKQIIQDLEKELKAAIDKANGYVDKEAYSRIVSQNGGVGMNASTSPEATTYFYSLPMNRVELWFMLTSQVFRNPIMREFYKERDVVREERRRRSESTPQGRLFELLMQTTFLAHPQRNLIGFASDIENLRAKDAEELFRRYYVPSNMVMVIAGDVDPKDIKRMADQYFSGMPSAPTPPRVITVEPKQEGERRSYVETESQPMVYMLYKRPSGTDPDDAPLTVLARALSGGRTSVIHKELVEDKKLALDAAAIDNFGVNKFPTAFMVVSIPAQGKTVDENEKALLEIIDRYKKEKFDEAVLKRVKTQIRAGLVRQLDSNMGMAQNMAESYILFGDWRPMFTSIEDIDKVTAEDVRRVNEKYLTNSNRTVVYLKSNKGDSK